MTHSKEAKEMLAWLDNPSWHGCDEDHGDYLTKAAPPEARESFRKWAAYQDSLDEDEASDYTLEIIG